MTAEPTQPPSEKPSLHWEIGAVILLLLNVYFAILEGSREEKDLPALIGFSSGPVIVTLVVIWKARALGRARGRRGAAVVAFWTLLVTLLTTCAGFVNQAASP